VGCEIWDLGGEIKGLRDLRYSLLDNDLSFTAYRLLLATEC
jgi:hypothetical protein